MSRFFRTTVIALMLVLFGTSTLAPMAFAGLAEKPPAASEESKESGGERPTVDPDDEMFLLPTPRVLSTRPVDRPLRADPSAGRAGVSEVPVPPPDLRA